MRGRASSTKRPLVLLVAAMVVSAALLLYLTRGTTFAYDEWLYFAGYPRFNTLLNPDEGHLVVLPVLYYKAALALFGASYLPERLLSVALTLTCAGLVYQVVRKSIGDWLALLPATLLLFLGSAWDILDSPLGLIVSLAFACVLGALLALERQTRGGDLLACALVSLGLCSFGGTAPLSLGLLVLILLQGGERRWRRSLVVVAPLLVWFAWYLWAPDVNYLPGVDTRFAVDHVVNAPKSLLQALGSAAQAVTGLYLPDDDPNRRVLLGWALAPIVLAVLAWRLWRGPRLSNRGWALIVMILALWLSFAATGKYPGASRYTFLGAALLLMLAAEAIAGMQLRRPLLAAIVAAFSFSLVVNLVQLSKGSEAFRHNAALAKAKLAGLEAIRGDVPRDTAIQPLSYPEPTATAEIFFINAGQYFDAIDDHGSPALTERELRAAPEPERETADKVMIRGLQLHKTEPLSAAPPRSAPTPLLRRREGAAIERAGACWVVRATGSQAVAIEFEVPRGGLSVLPNRGGAHVFLRRYAAAFEPFPIELRPGQARAIEIAVDRSNVPWTALLTTGGAATVCGAG